MTLKSVIVTCVLLLLSLPSGGAFAQTVGPGVAVTGVVLDQTGAVLPGAAVDLADAAGAVVRSTTTDGRGEFHFDAVPGGQYDLRAAFSGFKGRSTRMRVGARAPGPQRLVLSLTDVRQEITVGSGGAEVGANASNNLDAVGLDREALDSLPVLDQDVIATMSRFLDSGSIGSGGPTIVVNGMEVSALRVSASAIEQIKINSDPYSAEYARPGRGRIEIITKAGAQAYHGAFNLTFRDAALNSRDYFAVVKPPQQRRIYEGSASGPVLGGKTTSFLASIDRREEDVQAIVFAQDLSGVVQQNVPQPRRGLQLSASLNHQQGTKNLISLR